MKCFLPPSLPQTKGWFNACKISMRKWNRRKYERPRVNVKVERGSILRYAWDLSYIASIFFTRQWKSTLRLITPTFSSFLSFLLSRKKKNEKLFGVAWKETAKNGTSCSHTSEIVPVRWRRAFVDLNSSPHFWIFTSVSMSSSVLSWLFTSVCHKT